MATIETSCENKPIENNNLLDLDTLLQSDSGRKIFTCYLKEFNNSSDNLLTLYLICCCFSNHQRMEDRQRIKQILEKTYNACFIKNQLPYLNAELKQKLGESLQKTTYNESLFNAVKKELKHILQHDYFPKFIMSKSYKEYIQNKIDSNLTQNQLDSNNKLNLKYCNNQQQKINQQQHSKTKLTVANNNSKDVLDEFIDSSCKENYSFDLFACNPNKNVDNINNKYDPESQFAMPLIPKNVSNSSLSKINQETTRFFKNQVTNTLSTSSSVSSLQSTINSKKNNQATNGLNTSISSNTSSSSRNLKSNNNNNNNLISNKNSSKTFPHLINIPPNPYHDNYSIALPASIQDSELQSMVSGGDIQFDDQDNNNLKANVSCNLSNYSCSKNSKLYKQIKQNIIANKNIQLNLIPIDDKNDQYNIIADNKAINKKANEKKIQTPLSESDPKLFFDMVSSKLEKFAEMQQQQQRDDEEISNKATDQYLDEQHLKPLKHKSFSNSNIPLSYAQKIDQKSIRNFHNQHMHPKKGLMNNLDSADIDSQLDEHIDRVYNGSDQFSIINKHNDCNNSYKINRKDEKTTNNSFKLVNNNNISNNKKISKSRSKSPAVGSSAKMCVKIPNLNNNIDDLIINQFSNKLLLDENINECASSNNPTRINDHNNIECNDSRKSNKQNASFISLKAPTFNENKINKLPTNHNGHQSSHHFYQLTTTCKEVDIDSQSNQNKIDIGANSINIDILNKNLSKQYKYNKNTNNHSESYKNNNIKTVNYDSGVSIRSAASIERVNDWLVNSGLKSKNENENNYNNDNRLHKNNREEKNETIKANKTCIKTTVAYYLPGEELAYISTFNDTQITLYQFKQLITKKGHFRYFFKTKSDLLDDEVVFQEVTDDSSNIPMFNNKVIAKIEKIN